MPKPHDAARRRPPAQNLQPAVPAPALQSRRNQLERHLADRAQGRRRTHSVFSSPVTTANHGGAPHASRRLTQQRPYRSRLRCRDRLAEETSPASPKRTPRFFRGSGTWASRSRRYWLRAAAAMGRAAAIGEDGIGGRPSLGAGDGERRELPPFRPAPPAAHEHATPLQPPRNPRSQCKSRLCRVPAAGPGAVAIKPAPAAARLDSILPQ